MNTIFPITLGAQADADYFYYGNLIPVTPPEQGGTCFMTSFELYARASITAKRTPNNGDPVLPDGAKYGYAVLTWDEPTCWDYGAGCGICGIENLQLTDTYIENVGTSWSGSVNNLPSYFASTASINSFYLGYECDSIINQFGQEELVNCRQFWEDSPNCPGVYGFAKTVNGMPLQDLDQASVAAMFGFAWWFWGANGARLRYINTYSENQYINILYKQIPSFLEAGTYYKDIVVTHSDHPTWGKVIVNEETLQPQYIPFPPLNLAMPEYSLTEQTDTKRVWTRGENDKIVIELKNEITSEDFLDELRTGRPRQGEDLIYSDQGDFIISTFPRGRVTNMDESIVVFDGVNGMVSVMGQFYYSTENDWATYLPFDTWTPRWWGPESGNAPYPSPIDPSGRYTLLVWSPSNGIRKKEVEFSKIIDNRCDNAVRNEQGELVFDGVIFSSGDIGEQTFILAILETTSTAFANHVRFNMPDLYNG